MWKGKSAWCSTTDFPSLWWTRLQTTQERKMKKPIVHLTPESRAIYGTNGTNIMTIASLTFIFNTIEWADYSSKERRRIPAANRHVANRPGPRKKHQNVWMFIWSSYMINAAYTFVFIQNKPSLYNIIQMHMLFPLNVNTLQLTSYVFCASESLLSASSPADQLHLHHRCVSAPWWNRDINAYIPCKNVIRGLSPALLALHPCARKSKNTCAVRLTR